VLDSVSDAPASHNSPRPSEVGERRTYVLDTNVLLYDPRALFVFDEHDIVIPMTVIEEIDRFKKDLNETGRNARTISRILDELRERGSLRDGVRLDGGGVLRVDYQPTADEPRWPSPGARSTADNRILRHGAAAAAGGPRGQTVADHPRHQHAPEVRRARGAGGGLPERAHRGGRAVQRRGRAPTTSRGRDRRGVRRTGTWRSTAGRTSTRSSS
jgi:hypothetical protein